MSNIKLLIPAVLLGTGLHGSCQSDQKNLAHITPFVSLTFIQRNGNCISGRTKSADASRIIVESIQLGGTKKLIEIQREDLLFVGEAASPHNVLFSGRSSWEDVRGAHPQGPYESLRVTLKNGKHASGKPLHIDENFIEVKEVTRSIAIHKSEIATVNYIRAKPTTDAMQYIDQEAPWMLLLDPEFYYRATGLPGRLSVRLYDASKPEENFAVTCQSAGTKPPLSVQDP